MTSTVTWFIEKRVIHLRTFGVVEAEELRQCRDIILQYTAVGDGPVHVLVDHTGIERYVPSPGFLRNMGVPHFDPKSGWVVLISPAGCRSLR
jgi:hypothetical protein